MKNVLAPAVLFLAAFGPTNAAAQAIRSNAAFKSSIVPRNDDGSSPAVSIGFTINFFGRDRATAYVNNNGNITFDAALSTYTPFGLVGTRREIIAPFFADVDTRHEGSELVTYGNDTIGGKRAFGVNYVNVGYYNTKSDKLNSFQLVLIERPDTGDGNFDIEFNYGRVTWETGDASGGTGGYGGVPASAGWSNGSGEPGTSFELDGSLIPGSFLESGSRSLSKRRLNSTVTGRYLFRARGGSIAPPFGVVAPSVLPTATVGEPYSLTVSAVGGMDPQRWTLIPDPGVTIPGLTLSPAGVLRGTPTETGTFDFTFSVTARTDDGEQTATRRSSITIVSPALAITTDSCLLPAATVGLSYAHQLAARGGNGNYAWSWGSQAPVDGLSLSSQGRITGAPTTPGVYTFAVSVAAPESTPGSRTCRLTVRPAPLSAEIAVCPSLTATRDVPYAQTLTAGGGTAPYRWNLIGQLPPGLSLDSQGRVSGIPGVAGYQTFTLEITDSRGQQAQRSCTIAVDEPQLDIATACPLPATSAGALYNERLVVIGGQGPYGWSVVGSLPAGLSIRSDGTLTGRPTSIGPHHFRLVASDVEGRAASKPCNIIVNRTGGLSIASCPLPPGRLGQSYQQNLAVVGGFAPYTWMIDGPLPEGVMLTNSGFIHGTPSIPGDTHFTLRVSDRHALVATQSCSIAVEPEALEVDSACPLPLARVGASYETRVSARGGIPPYTWSARGLLPDGVTLSSDGQFSGSPSIIGEYPTALVVSDSRGRRQSLDCVLSVGVPDLPAVRFSGLAPVMAPAVKPTAVFELAQPYPLPLQGEVNVSINAETGSLEPEVNRADATIRFLNGSRTNTFTVPAGVKKIEIPLTSSGTVASRVTVAVTSLKAGGHSFIALPSPASFQVNRLAPVVTDACYATGTAGLTIRLTGYSTPRDLSAVEVTPGGSGSAAQTISLSTIASEYFFSDASVRTGGSFSLEVPTGILAPSNLSAVSVTLRNSVGSAPAQQARRCN